VHAFTALTDLRVYCSQASSTDARAVATLTHQRLLACLRNPALIRSASIALTALSWLTYLYFARTSAQWPPPLRALRALCLSCCTLNGGD
jgi:hypothetical protein